MGLCVQGNVWGKKKEEDDTAVGMDPDHGVLLPKPHLPGVIEGLDSLPSRPTARRRGPRERRWPARGRTRSSRRPRRAGAAATGRRRRCRRASRGDLPAPALGVHRRDQAVLGVGGGEVQEAVGVGVAAGADDVPGNPLPGFRRVDAHDFDGGTGPALVPAHQLQHVEVAVFGLDYRIRCKQVKQAVLTPPL